MKARRGRETDGPPLTASETAALLKVERQLTAAIQELAKSLRESARDRVEGYEDEVLLALKAIAGIRDACEDLCRLEILMARRGTKAAWPLGWPALGDALRWSKQRLHRRYRPFVVDPDMPGLITELESRGRRMQTLAGTLKEAVAIGRPRHRRKIAEEARQDELRVQQLRAQNRGRIVPDLESESDPQVRAWRQELADRGLLHESTPEMKRRRQEEIDRLYED